ncbi:MAG: type II toxin-antitoxin system prevent-host-death family antitoxin [Actinobacteria bacterium]|nr:type II toxin-antitoxin system prevent-host-death family antitoxin [Actinomycetota bacterium]
MNRVTHREMRNQSGEILRRVAAGESIEVTNRGRVAALIVPPQRSLEALVERGEVRIAARDARVLRSIKRRRSNRTSAEILADTRGRW